MEGLEEVLWDIEEEELFAVVVRWVEEWLTAALLPEGEVDLWVVVVRGVAEGLTAVRLPEAEVDLWVVAFWPPGRAVVDLSVVVDLPLAKVLVPCAG